MTASSQPANDRNDLPAVTALLADAIRIVKRHGGDYFGFAGWLLLPLLFIVAAFATGGAIGNLLINLANVSFVLLLFWFAVAGTALTAALVRHPDRVIDPRHLGAAAWQRVTGVLVTMVLAAVLELAGIVLLVVPGVIVATYLAFALEESVLNNRVGFAGLAASRDAVRGNFWAVFWRIVGLVATFGLVYLTLVTLVVLGAALLGWLDPAALTQAPPPLWLEVTLSVLQIALLPFALTAHVLLYLSLEKG